MPTALAMLVSHLEFELTPEVGRATAGYLAITHLLHTSELGVLLYATLGLCAYKEKPWRLSVGQLAVVALELAVSRKEATLAVGCDFCGLVCGLTARLANVQVAGKSIEELEAVRGTLQFRDGLQMFCTPRDCAAAAPSA